jgi:hypothetical protein
MDTIDDVAGLVSIGQLAKAAGVSSRTIRYYEELGRSPPDSGPGRRNWWRTGSRRWTGR